MSEFHNDSMSGGVDFVADNRERTVQSDMQNTKIVQRRQVERDIYPLLNLVPISPDAVFAPDRNVCGMNTEHHEYLGFSEKELDCKREIDYYAADRATGNFLYVQGRVRQGSYANTYDDFTIRYTRLNSISADQQLSEFFKMKETCRIIKDTEAYCMANQIRHYDLNYFMIYAFTDGYKIFKWVTVDLLWLYDLINAGYIAPVNNIQPNTRVVASLQCNKDHSSEFIGIRIPELYQAFPDAEEHIWQVGFDPFHPFNGRPAQPKYEHRLEIRY